MPDGVLECRCLDHDDKSIMLKIINDVIDKENEELRRIESVKRRALLRPPGFTDSFVGIRSSLKRVHEDYKKNVEEFKKKVESYPRCGTVRPKEDIKVNVVIPGYSEKTHRLF